jgi:cytochrome c2
VGPIHSWVPSIAISNLIYLQNFHKRWNGDLVLGSLKSRSLYRIRVKGNKVRFVERIFLGERVRDLVQVQNKIIVYTDSSKLLILNIDKNKLISNARSVVDVRNKAMQKCTECHHFGETSETHSAPSLTGVVGRKIASDNFSRYSEGLKKNSNKIWSLDNLRSYIVNPNKFSPGTYMPEVNVNEYELEKILKILLTNSEN